MALTQPTMPAIEAQCTVTVSSVDGNAVVPFTLTTGQMSTWTDQDLTDRTAALKAAVEGFLPAGVDIRVQVAWVQQTSVMTVNTAEQVN